MAPEPKPRTTTATVEDQPALAPLPEDVEQESTELESMINRTAQDALAKLPSITDKDIERILNARAALIKTVRAVAIRMTHPHDWTLYRAKDGTIVGVPAAAACLVMRRWAGISIRDHRGTDGRAGVPTRHETTNSKGDPVFVLEMLADGFWGQNEFPDAESVPANLRSDDDFTGRTKREERHGGPRPEDLSLSLRTTLDSKVVRVMLGITKVTEEELVSHGLDVKKCTKGSGFGSGSERAAGGVATEEVKARAEKMKKEHLAAADGKLAGAVLILKECTKYNSFKGSDGNDVPASPGLDSWDKFTTIAKIEKAEARWKKHPLYPAPEDTAGQ